MKRIVTAALWLSLLAGSAHAGSSIMAPKPVIQDTLTPDNSTWTGLKYNGIPVKQGSDAIGHNVNYVYQVTTITNTNGSVRFQVYLRAFAPSAYNAAITELGAVNPALGVSTYTFEDSGIVMPKATYLSVMKTPLTRDWSWNLILSYNVPAGDATAFKVAMSQWIAGKLTQSATSGNTSYYWK